MQLGFNVLWMFTILALSQSLRQAQASSGQDYSDCTVLAIVLPFAGHMLPMLTLGQELQARGHNVCVASLHLTPDFPESSIKQHQLQFISVPTNYTYETWSAELESLGQGKREPMKELWGVLTGMRRRDGEIYRHLQKMTLELEKVRLVIADVFSFWSGLLMQEELPGDVTVVFNIATFDPFRRPPWPHPTSQTGFSKSMTFKERVISEVLAGLTHAVIRGSSWMLKDFEVTHFGKQVGMGEKPGVRWPLLVNSAPGFDYPVAVGPLVHYVGPLLQEKSKEELSASIQGWLASNEVGGRPLVLVSMGSHAHLQDDVGWALYSGLKATGLPVLWALRSRNRKFLEGVEVPARIRLENWLPQRKLLEYEDVAALVGHCGSGGTQEALFNAVPVVCIPFHGDQPDAAARLQDSGAGVTLILKTLTADDVTAAVDKLIGLPKAAQGKRNRTSYADAAARVSKYLKAAGGVRRAADIVESVLETGCDHLITQDVQMSWVVGNKLDIGAFFVAVCLGFALVVRAVYAVFLAFVFGGGKKLAKVKAS